MLHSALPEAAEQTHVSRAEKMLHMSSLSLPLSAFSNAIWCSDCNEKVLLLHELQSPLITPKHKRNQNKKSGGENISHIHICQHHQFLIFWITFRHRNRHTSHPFFRVKYQLNIPKMIIELAILILLIILFLSVIFALYYYGSFEEVEVSVGNSPYDFSGQMIAYKLARGPYSSSGHLFTELTGDVYRITPDLPRMDTIGFYYDDPDEIEDHEKLRYAVGLILPPVSDDDDFQEALMSGLESKGYLMARLPSVDHVVHSSFPFKGAFSIIVAVKKVYPVIKSFVRVSHPTYLIMTSSCFMWLIIPFYITTPMMTGA